MLEQEQSRKGLNQRQGLQEKEKIFSSIFWVKAAVCLEGFLFCVVFEPFPAQFLYKEQAVQSSGVPRNARLGLCSVNRQSRRASTAIAVKLFVRYI